jgi:hypothetical protein
VKQRDGYKDKTKINTKLQVVAVLIQAPRIEGACGAFTASGILFLGGRQRLVFIFRLRPLYPSERAPTTPY